MKVDVLLGLQWGDEGKGKVVDVLTPRYDVVARFQGGPNAGRLGPLQGVRQKASGSRPMGADPCQYHFCSAVRRRSSAHHGGSLRHYPHDPVPLLPSQRRFRSSFRSALPQAWPCLCHDRPRRLPCGIQADLDSVHLRKKHLTLSQRNALYYPCQEGCP